MCLYKSFSSGRVAVKMKSCLNIKDDLHSISEPSHAFNFVFKSKTFKLLLKFTFEQIFCGEGKFGFISIVVQEIPINFCMKNERETLCKAACVKEIHFQSTTALYAKCCVCFCSFSSMQSLY